ncbi:hypothetical protein G6M89_15175 [Natronolimnobius sp. AArcel1]|uniref:hypothetical protein n=1 Tax=Natronolimnobius sp. AArcel1 TaxID=1679093 RepID=UPI0013EDC7DB|nr:hypothetical protein [Natronolimnobius sp. AArcel1]NGM70335.1 hypothetical protein [Natronolimnobius sp. AArcel1]
MNATHTCRQALRALILVALVAVLVGLTAWYGAAGPSDSASSQLPSESEFGPETTAYVGERVSATGTIVDDDPVTLEVEYNDESSTIILEGYTAPATVGSYELVTGTLRDESTIVVVGSEARAPWEAIYMYIVSALAGCWVFVRLARGWRFDRSQLALTPRVEPSRPIAPSETPREATTSTDGGQRCNEEEADG